MDMASRAQLLKIRAALVAKVRRTEGVNAARALGPPPSAEHTPGEQQQLRDLRANLVKLVRKHEGPEAADRLMDKGAPKHTGGDVSGFHKGHAGHKGHERKGRKR